MSATFKGAGVAMSMLVRAESAESAVVGSTLESAETSLLKTIVVVDDVVVVVGDVLLTTESEFDSDVRVGAIVDVVVVVAGVDRCCDVVDEGEGDSVGDGVVVGDGVGNGDGLGVGMGPGDVVVAELERDGVGKGVGDADVL